MLTTSIRITALVGPRPRWVRRSLSSPGTSASRRAPRARSTSGTRALTNGTSRLPLLGVDLQQILPGQMQHRRDPADLGAARVEHPQPDQLPVVELLGVRSAARRPARRPRAARRCSDSTADRSGSLDEADEQPAGVSRGSTPRSGPDRCPRRAAPPRRAKRRSGSSVRSATATSPRTPCGRPTTPTTTSTVSKRSAPAGATGPGPVHVDEVDPDADRGRPGPRSRSAARWRCDPSGR